MQFFEKSLHAAWRGKRGILWPILIRFFMGVLRIALFWATFALIIGIAGADLSVGGGYQIGIYLFMLMFLILILWWFFSASCRLMWFHDLASGSANEVSRSSWLGDLPAMLGIDVIFGLLKWLNIGAIFIGMAGMLVNQSSLSLLCMTVGCVMAIVCSVLEPAVTAQRIVDGPGFLNAVQKAVSRIICYPARTLCIRFMPHIVSLLCYAAAGWEGLTGHGMIMIGLAVIGVLISLIQPVFWTEFAGMKQE